MLNAKVKGTNFFAFHMSRSLLQPGTHRARDLRTLRFSPHSPDDALILATRAAIQI